MARQIYPLIRFDGGLNTKAQPFQVHPTQSPDLLNVYPTDRGGIATRRGYSYLNNSALTMNNTAVSLLDIVNFRRVSGELLVAFGVNSTTSTSGAWFWNASTSRLSLITDSTNAFNASAPRIITAQYANILYMSDGYRMYKYDGTSLFTRMGVSSPTGTVTATCGGTGGVSAGTYLWKYTYVNSAGVESNPNSAMTTAFTLTSAGQASLTGLQNPGSGNTYGINGLIVYRTSAGGATYYKVTSMAPTATFLDNVSDASLGAAVPSVNYPPATHLVMVSHRDRMFFAVNTVSDSTKRNRVYWSKIATPEIVNLDTDFIRYSDDGEDIFNLATNADQLLVCKRISVHELHMPDPSNSLSWFSRKTPVEFGSESYTLAVPLRNGFVLLSRKGFALMTSQGEVESTIQLASDTFRSKTISEVINDTLLDPTTGVAPANVIKTAGINFNNAIWISVPEASSVNNRVYYFDYQRGPGAVGIGGWFKFSNMNFSSFAELSNILYASSSGGDGYIYKLEVANQWYDSINSGACLPSGNQGINSYYLGPSVGGSPRDIQTWKNLRAVRLITSAMSSTSLIIGIAPDFNPNLSSSFHVNQDPVIDPIGVTGTVGYTNRVMRVYVPDGTSGRTFQWRVSNSAVCGTAFSVFQVDLEYNTRGRR